MVDIRETKIPGVQVIFPDIFRDHRGRLVKHLNRDLLKERDMDFSIAEEYYSVSRKGVLRGIHFQVPPHEHFKMVFCPKGRILDVSIDLRKGSPSYGRVFSTEIDSDMAAMLYLPPGIGHGFYTLSDEATVMYSTSVAYHPESDSGILWSSINMEWPDSSPVLSDRDRKFVPFEKFRSPFVYQRDPDRSGALQGH